MPFLVNEEAALVDLVLVLVVVEALAFVFAFDFVFGTGGVGMAVYLLQLYHHNLPPHQTDYNHSLAPVMENATVIVELSLGIFIRH